MDRRPHAYHPSTMHMGDCSICGNVADHPNHKVGGVDIAVGARALLADYDRRHEEKHVVTPFAKAYPAPWRIGDREIVDRDGCNVQDINDGDPDELEFWRGIVAAVNANADDGFNPHGSGPVPIERRDEP